VFSLVPLDLFVEHFEQLRDIALGERFVHPANDRDVVNHRRLPTSLR